MIYFTSDTHYFHRNIIEFCNRPFSDLDHMHEMLILGWNRVVQPDDTVYHLGDVAFQVSMKFPQILNILERLNGKKILVAGNHDKQFLRKMDEMLHIWDNVHTEPVFLDSMLLAHHPTYDRAHLMDGGVVLHGHEHSEKNIRPYRMYDVGVDANSYTPISLNSIKTIMKNRRDYVHAEEVGKKTARDTRHPYYLGSQNPITRKDYAL